MSRLTKSLKDEIVSRVIKDVTGVRAEILKAGLKEAADQAYYEIYTPDEVSYMKSGPKDAFYQEESLWLGFDGRHRRLDMSKVRPVFADRAGRYHVFQLDEGSPVRAVLDGLRKEEAALEEDRSALRREVRSVLNSVTTVKRLLDVWPEAEKYLPDRPETPNLPAVVVADLNKKIEILKSIGGAK